MSYYNHLLQAQHTQPKTQKTKNTNTMITPSHQLPVTPVSRVSAIVIYFAIAHDPHNIVMWLFHMKLTNSPFYKLLFSRLLTGALLAKRKVFWVNTCPFSLVIALNQHALTPAVCQYFFCQCLQSPCHVLAWFWTRGGARHGHNVFCARCVIISGCWLQGIQPCKKGAPMIR